MKQLKTASDKQKPKYDFATLDIYTHLFEKASQHTTDVMTDAIAKARKEKMAK